VSETWGALGHLVGLVWPLAVGALAPISWSVPSVSALQWPRCGWFWPGDRALSALRDNRALSRDEAEEGRS